MVVRFRLVVFLLLLGSPVRAQVLPDPAPELSDTTVVLPGVTVTAARTATATVDAPVHVTVLDSRDIDRSGSRTVAELLARHSGAFLRQYGGGGLVTLSLRGTSSSQTLLLLDGHRISDPQLGQIDLSLLPTILLQSVEVMHGAGSALYGSDGMGGVVHLRTLSPGPQPFLKAGGGYGAFGSRRGALMGGVAKGRVAFTGVAEYETAAGDYPYLNTARFPPAEVRREGADLRRLSLYATGSYRGAGGRLRVSGWYGDAERGLPTLFTRRSRGERQWDDHLRLWADHEMQIGTTNLRIGGLLQRSALRYINEQLGIDDTGRTELASLDAVLEAPLGRHWLVSGAAQAGLGRARHPSLAEDAAQMHTAVSASATGVYGPLFLYPAMRADAYYGSVPEAALSPRLGINLKLASGVHARASAGRAFRMPTLNDRYWQPGGRPDLRPERGWMADAGLSLRSGPVHADVTLFTARLVDQIVWSPTTSSYWAPDNVSRVVTQGVEAAVRERWRYRRLRVESGIIYSLTDTRDRSDPALASYGRQVRYVPRQQVNAHAGLGLGPLWVGASGTYAGHRSVTSDGTEKLEPYLVLDGQIRLDLRPSRVHTSLTFYLENMLDDDYMVLQAQPMPPRHARFQITLRFQ